MSDSKIRFLVDGSVVSKSSGEIIQQFTPLSPACVKVLRVLASRPMTVSDICSCTDVCAASVRTYLGTCVQRGYVVVVGRASRHLLYAATEKALEVVGSR